MYCILLYCIDEIIYISGDDGNGMVHCIDISEDQSGKQIKETILQSCDLCNIKNIVLKVLPSFIFFNVTYLHISALKKCDIF
jgi:hypothetical protein